MTRDPDFYDPQYPPAWIHVAAAWCVLTLARAVLVVWRVRWWLEDALR